MTDDLPSLDAMNAEIDRLKRDVEDAQRQAHEAQERWQAALDALKAYARKVEQHLAADRGRA